MAHDASQGRRQRAANPGVPDAMTVLRNCLLVSLVVMWVAPHVRAQTPVASSSGTTACATTHHAYTVDVCLITPGKEAPFTTDPTIKATVKVSDQKTSVLSMTFALNGRNILSDFDPPYSFVLPIRNWVDGSYTLTVTASLSDNSKTTPVAAPVRFHSGTETVALTSESFSPTAGHPALQGEPFVVAAVGDGAGGSPESAAVTDEISSWNPNLFLYLGDVYNGGSTSEYANWYAPETYFGRFKSITDPTIGNHEYGGKAGPQGYLQYWGNPPHYYSVDTAGWHLISLDTNPKFAETDPASQQMQWLIKDLDGSKSACTLVFYHQPRFNVGTHGDDQDLQGLWNILAQHNVTLVLTGHDHNYQRWQALDGNGALNPDGVTSVIVGTGGQTEYPVLHEDPRLAVPPHVDPGALRLELNPHGAVMDFFTTDGIVRDSTVVPCKGAGHTADTTAPSTPGLPTAVRASDGSVTVSWPQSTDDTGVASYHVYRDNTLLGSVSPQSAFVDVHADPTKQSVYRVVARDAAGNSSASSGTTQTAGASVSGVLFAEDFSSKSFGRWTDSSIDVESPDASHGEDGRWIARARGGIRPAYARVTLPGQFFNSDQIDLEVSIDFCSFDQGDNSAVLFRLRTPDDKTLFSTYIAADGSLGVFNDTAGTGAQDVQKVVKGTWHRITAHVAGPLKSPRLTVSFDGKAFPTLNETIDLSSGPIGILQLGDSTGNREYDIQYRDITVESPYQAASATPMATRPLHPDETGSATNLMQPQHGGQSQVGMGTGIEFDAWRGSRQAQQVIHAHRYSLRDPNASSVSSCSMPP